VNGNTGRTARAIAVAGAFLALLAGCTTPEPEPDRGSPDEAPIPLSAPVGGSRFDFDVDGFDTCTPFASSLWTMTAAADLETRTEQLAEPAGACRWHGPGMRATVSVDSGRTPAEYSNDPQFRPGGRGAAYNVFWETATSDATRVCHFFLAAGPAQPDRVVHMLVETDDVTGPTAGGGRMHACMFGTILTDAASLVLKGPETVVTTGPS